MRVPYQQGSNQTNMRKADNKTATARNLVYAERTRANTSIHTQQMSSRHQHILCPLRWCLTDNVQARQGMAASPSMREDRAA